MRFARFLIADQIAYGPVEGDDADPAGMTVTAIDGHPFAPFEQTTARFPLADVKLLPPVLPSKVIGIGKNYAAHAREMGGDAPSTPVMFLKPSTSVIGDDEAIVLPPQSKQVEHEAELAVVIGRLAREVPADRVAEVVLGVTCANDVTARDLQRSDGQWVRAKGFDSFCPTGPWIATDVEFEDLLVQAHVNGDLRQSGRTSEMVHSVSELVQFVSSVMTLLPGDLILTGTPAGVGVLEHGDEVTISIENVGSLSNRVVRA
ncbi:MAG TPA: fumarylacetoacetate hydrolase family protein [Actinomycetes bacterium]|nr:fumarylacetoacetate hydrolase family protein [Actinomycetes bacterium]